MICMYGALRAGAMPYPAMLLLTEIYRSLIVKRFYGTFEHELAHKGIQHVTIQMENSENPHENSVMCRTQYEVHLHHQH